MAGGTTIVDRLNKLSGKDATTIAKALENLEEGGGIGGFEIHICASGEYDAETKVPTIEEPDSSTLYLVPTTEEAGDLFDEYIWTGETWERFGAGSINIQNPDWNENDPTSVAYIENRPFYMKSGKTVYDGTLTFTGTGAPSILYAQPSNTDFIMSEGVEVGDKIDLSINGELLFSGIISEYSGYPAIGITNPGDSEGIANKIGILFRTGDASNEYKFAANIMGTTDWAELNKTYTFKVTRYACVKIAEEFIPFKEVTWDEVLNKPNLYGKTSNALALNFSYNTATGQYAIAEGYRTKATGNYSHAEGSSTSSGIYSHAEGIDTKATGAGSHTEGNQTEASNEESHAEGYTTKATGKYSHAEGYLAKATGLASHAEGNQTTASGNHSHAEGNTTIAYAHSSHVEGVECVAGVKSNANSGTGAHAEGIGSVASGNYSHAEGSSKAQGDYSHAEGSGTAKGQGSHAEGNDTIASGSYSHAEGQVTTAASTYQHVFGKYNVEDANDVYVEIVGNGNSKTTKSNARTLDWSGNESLAGSLTLGKGTADEVTVTAAQLKALIALLTPSGE